MRSLRWWPGASRWLSCVRWGLRDGRSSPLGGLSGRPDLAEQALFLTGIGLAVVFVKGAAGVYATFVQGRVAGEVGGSLRLALLDALLTVHRLRRPRQSDHGAPGVQPPAHAVAALTDRVHDVELGLKMGLLGGARAVAQLVPLAAVLVVLSPRMAAVAAVVLAGFGSASRASAGWLPARDHGGSAGARALARSGRRSGAARRPLGELRRRGEGARDRASPRERAGARGRETRGARRGAQRRERDPRRSRALAGGGGVARGLAGRRRERRDASRLRGGVLPRLPPAPRACRRAARPGAGAEAPTTSCGGVIDRERVAQRAIAGARTGPRRRWSCAT